MTALLGLGLVAAMVWLIHRSIMARQQAAAVLHEQREWFRTTLAGIGDAVIATDTQSNVRFLNFVAQDLTGWAEQDAQGQPLESIFQIVNEQTREGREPDLPGTEGGCDRGAGQPHDPDRPGRHRAAH